MERIGLRAYARHRGCSLKTVQQAIADGRIRTDARGRIESAQADADWLANTDPSQSAAPADFQEARTEQLLVRIARDKLELEQRRSRLIGLDEAKRLAFTAFRALRDSLMSIPARIKDQCAGETDPRVIEQLIDAELVLALGKFDAGNVLRDDDETE